MPNTPDGKPAAGAPAAPKEPASAWLLGLVLLSGFLGGAVSAVAPLQRGGASRVPDLLSSWQFAVLRPVVGAASALFVYFFVAAGVFPLTSTGVPSALAIAFAAGFSERLLTTAIAGAHGDKPDAKRKGRDE